MEHSAILSTFIKLPFSIKTFVLSIFKRPLKTGFTVTVKWPFGAATLSSMMSFKNSVQKLLTAFHKNNI